jgi:hypothetical protein
LTPGSNRVRPGDGGFTLLELMVAFAVAALVVIAVGASMRGALGSSRGNRLRSEAVGIAMETIEFGRSLDWEQLALPAVDPDAPLIDPDAGVLLASASGVGEDEALKICPTGAIPPRTITSVQGTDFTTWAFVTQPTPSLRRLFVLVTWDIEGTPQSHDTSTVISTVTAAAADVGGGQPVFPDAAIIATGNVDLHPGSTVSDPPGSGAASVILNGNFSNEGAVVDGDIEAGGTVNADPANVAGTIEQNAGTPVQLPGAAEIEAWRDNLRSQAQSGTVLAGSQKFKDTTVTAPIFIDGTLVVEGTVIIEGSGPIYVTGSLKLQGGPYVSGHGVVLVSDTAVEFSGGTQYDVTAASGGVVSFGASATALKLTGGSDSYSQGLAFAPYGGIELSGTSAWHGGLIAGGDGTLGRVNMSGGSVVDYPAGLAPASGVLTGLTPEPEPSLCP